MLFIGASEGKLDFCDVLKTFLVFGLLEPRLEAIEGHFGQGHPGFRIELHSISTRAMDNMKQDEPTDAFIDRTASLCSQTFNGVFSHTHRMGTFCFSAS